MTPDDLPSSHPPVKWSGPPGRRIQKIWRAYHDVATRALRPLLMIPVSAWRLPALWCASISYLLNQWVIPALVAFTAFRAMRPAHPQTWQTAIVIVAAVVAAAKLAAVELRPGGGRP